MNKTENLKFLQLNNIILGALLRLDLRQYKYLIFEN